MTHYVSVNTASPIRMWAGGQLLTDNRPYSPVAQKMPQQAPNYLYCEQIHTINLPKEGREESAVQSCSVSEREIEQRGRKRPHETGGGKRKGWRT